MLSCMNESVTKNCEVCNKPFVPGKFWARYCGKQCRMKNAAARRKQALELLNRVEAVESQALAQSEEQQT